MVSVFFVRTYTQFYVAKKIFWDLKNHLNYGLSWNQLNIKKSIGEFSISTFIAFCYLCVVAFDWLHKLCCTTIYIYIICYLLTPSFYFLIFLDCIRAHFFCETEQYCLFCFIFCILHSIFYVFMYVLSGPTWCKTTPKQVV